MMYKISKHASQDRIERLMYINMEIGIGEELCSTPSRDNTIEVLTTTGVLLVLDNDRKVITAYMASMDRATRVWRSAHGNIRMPNDFYELLLRNRAKYRKVQEIDETFGYHVHDMKKYKFLQKKS